MLEFSKQKRMQIMSQIGDKRQRLPSNQRRKLVEEEYNQFIKTMNSIKPNIPKSNESNKKQQPIRANGISKQFKREQLNFSYTPTINDIPKLPTDRESLNQQFYQIQNDKQQASKIESPVSIKQVNFYKPTNSAVNQVVEQNLNELKQEKSINHSQARVQDEQIKFLVNPSVQPSSVNSSQAIFFTSQFKQFINRQNSPPKETQLQEQIKQKQQIHKSIIKQKQQKEVLQIGSQHKKTQQEINSQNILKNNPSGQSLALSNDSSLKFSLQESAVHQVIAHKLKKQLVLESIGNQKFYQSLRSLALYLLLRQNIKDLSQFIRQVKLINLINRNKKVNSMREMIIKHQLFFELRKNEIRAQNHYKDKVQNNFRLSFYEWRNRTISKREAVEQFIYTNNKKNLQKIFRAFKMILYDRKIINQINLYYLSKIFFALKSITQKESKRNQQKAYRFYFKSLKKRMFKYMIDGIRARARERQNIEVANDHYYFSLMHRVFDAWKQKSPRQQRYIRLAMTTKNQLKLTADRRLFQTQTFDFSEIK